MIDFPLVANDLQLQWRFYNAWHFTCFRAQFHRHTEVGSVFIFNVFVDGIY